MKQPNKHSTVPTKRLMQDVICMINQAALLLSASKTSAVVAASLRGLSEPDWHRKLTEFMKYYSNASTATIAEVSHHAEGNEKTTRAPSLHQTFS
jgi:hypothetical protein